MNIAQGSGDGTMTIGSGHDIQLNPSAALSAALFQNLWKQKSVAKELTLNLNAMLISSLPTNNHQLFCQHMENDHIKTIASGGDAAILK